MLVLGEQVLPRWPSPGRGACGDESVFTVQKLGLHCTRTQGLQVAAQISVDSYPRSNRYA